MRLHGVVNASPDSLADFSVATTVEGAMIHRIADDENRQRFARYACIRLPVRAWPADGSGIGSVLHGMRAFGCQFGAGSQRPLPACWTVGS